MLSLTQTRRRLGPHRIVFLGGPNVGKTCLVKRCLGQTPSPEYLPTADDIYQTDICCACGNTVCPLQISDTSGERLFPGMRDDSIVTAHGAVIAFNLNDESSFDEAVEILHYLREVRRMHNGGHVRHGSSSYDSPLMERVHTSGSSKARKRKKSGSSVSTRPPSTSESKSPNCCNQDKDLKITSQTSPEVEDLGFDVSRSLAKAIRVVFVGCKLDLFVEQHDHADEDGGVLCPRAAAIARSMGCAYTEVSAVSGERVEEVLNFLLPEVCRQCRKDATTSSGAFPRLLSPRASSLKSRGRHDSAHDVDVGSRARRRQQKWHVLSA